MPLPWTYGKIFLTPTELAEIIRTQGCIDLVSKELSEGCNVGDIVKVGGVSQEYRVLSIEGTTVTIAPRASNPVN